MKTILFCDIDHTLIRKGELIHPKNLIALRRFRENGGILVYCTGRNESQVVRALSVLGGHYDGLIMNTGAYLKDGNGDILFKREIPVSVGLDVVRRCKELQDFFIGIYHSDIGQPLGLLNGNTVMQVEKGFDPVPNLDFHRMMDDLSGLETMFLYSLNENTLEMEDLQTWVQEKYPTEVTPHLNNNWLDIVPFGCDKSTGIREFLSTADPSCQSVSIGDATNDIPMFAVTDRSFTFRYSEPHVQAAADEVVDYVWEALARIGVPMD